MKDKIKILVAEDELLIAMDIKLKLEELGYEVTSLVSTAIEAITKSESDKPDIILMDVRLSGSLTGIDAAKIISYKHNIPIIFLTSGSSEDVLLHDKNFKSQEHIPKPVETLVMQQALEKIKQKILLSSKPMQDNFSQPSSFTY